MKVAILTTSDGDKYAIPAKEIAEHRANYCAITIDGHEYNSPEYLDEVEFGLSHEDELRDWFFNNTDWENFEEQAIRVHHASPISDLSTFDFEDFTIEEWSHTQFRDAAVVPTVHGSYTESQVKDVISLIEHWAEDSRDRSSASFGSGLKYGDGDRDSSDVHYGIAMGLEQAAKALWDLISDDNAEQ